LLLQQPTTSFKNVGSLIQHEETLQAEMNEEFNWDFMVSGNPTAKSGLHVFICPSNYLRLSKSTT